MFKIYDVLIYFIIFLIIFIAIFYKVDFNSENKPSKIEVYIDNKLSYIFKLTNEYKEYKIESQNGVSVIACENMEVWKISAPCRDKLCVKQGKINKLGESIICIPEKMVIKLSGGYSNVDAVIK